MWRRAMIAFLIGWMPVTTPFITSIVRGKKKKKEKRKEKTRRKMWTRAMVALIIGWMPVTMPFITMCGQSRRLEAGLSLDLRPRAVNALSCCTSTFARGDLLSFCHSLWRPPCLRASACSRLQHSCQCDAWASQGVYLSLLCGEEKHARLYKRACVCTHAYAST